MRFSFSAEVWEHDGMGSWHFISLPEDVGDDIEAGSTADVELTVQG